MLRAKSGQTEGTNRHIQRSELHNSVLGLMREILLCPSETYEAAATFVTQTEPHGARSLFDGRLFSPRACFEKPDLRISDKLYPMNDDTAS